MPFFLEPVLLAPLAFLCVAYGLAAWAGRGAARRASKPGERLFWFAREYCWTLVYLCVAVFVAPFDFVFRRRKLSPEGEGPLVVLLHGYFALPAHWIFGAWRLRRAGHKNVFRHSYHAFGGGLESWSETFAEKLRPHSARGIILVGHSAGGIVALWAADRLPEGSVRKVVVLASPLDGSLMARYAASPNARSLAPGSREIAKTRDILARTSVPVVCGWSDFDQLVVPGSSGAHARAANVELRGLGHTGWHFQADLQAFINR